VRILVAAVLILLALTHGAIAGCVYGAEAKSQFVQLDSHTIILKGGFGRDILIKTFAFLNRFSSITVLKDSLCSYESNVLYVDGNLAGVNQVEFLD
jgi:hypothetical protein